MNSSKFNSDEEYNIMMMKVDNQGVIKRQL